MPLKSIYEIFPNKIERDDFRRKKTVLERAIGRKLVSEEHIVAYIRYYTAYYGRYRKKKPKGYGHLAIGRRTGLTPWKVRMILRTITEPPGVIPKAKSKFEI